MNRVFRTIRLLELEGGWGEVPGQPLGGRTDVGRQLIGGITDHDDLSQRLYARYARGQRGDRLHDKAREVGDSRHEHLRVINKKRVYPFNFLGVANSI